MNNSRLVYSTDQGRICPECGAKAQKCQCRRGKGPMSPQKAGDGIVRIGREVKGRKGKGVTTISGINVDADGLKEIAARLKRLCGSGGSVKGGVVLIQGDHRSALAAELKKQGYKVKLSGG